MDSLTQIVLGAAVGELALGRKVGNHAILWGAVAGTIPDLDVIFKPFLGDLAGNEMHRGFSHSILFSVVMAPLFGFLINKLYQKRDVGWKGWSWLFFLGFFTHPLLDCHTTWGTQLFWPFDLRIAFKNISVVDPVYTVPFLILMIGVMFIRRSNPRRRKWAIAGLGLSSIYLLITFAFQYNATTIFVDNLKRQDIPYDRISVQPTIANSILWYASIETSDSYLIGLYSMLDDDKEVSFMRFKKNRTLRQEIGRQDEFKRLKTLADDWFLIEGNALEYQFSDLRFGKTSFGNQRDFVFNYQVKTQLGGVEVKQDDPPRENMAGFFNVLWTRIKGQ
jgi:inner membrane protein